MRAGCRTCYVEYGAMKTTWSVVALYEDAATREQAVQFCDQLVGRFWTQCNFEVSWWQFGLLQESTSARAATMKAAESKLLIIASRAEGDFPAAMKAWLESWLHQRGAREGSLVGLIGTGVEPEEDASSKHVYLRHLARRGGLNYLTDLPQELHHFLPDSLDAFNERATQVTGVLETILQSPVPPRGMG